MDHPVNELFLSSVTLAELRFGLNAQMPEDRRAHLLVWLSLTVRPMFAGRVLEVTEETMFIWRTLLQQGRKVNRTFSQPDLILGATAVQHNLILATRNTRDFSDLPIQLINPWD
jgi:predicted nucleic acid-binding protein